MREALAEQLLARVMGWDRDEVSRWLPELQALARIKYDDYGQYQPGVRFIETLTSWLAQFGTEERVAAMEFVRDRLIFISASEMQHLVELVYPRLIRPMLLTRTAERFGIPRHHVAQIVAREEFHSLERATLLLGLSDGARIDQLRRSCRSLSHEQFYLAPDPGPERFESMTEKLRKAQAARGLPTTDCFSQVILVDDFSGSGFTLLRREGDEWNGKLWKAASRFSEMVKQGQLDPNYTVTIVLYCASELARRELERLLQESGLGWDLRILQIIPEQACVPDGSAMIDLSRKYYDPKLRDEHKDRGGADAAVGFGGARLPLVLHHNTPNNSISILWGDTQDVAGSQDRCALFPRYERHHSERP